MSNTQGALALQPQATRRSDRFNQTEVLTEALRRIEQPTDIAVFDLDSTLLDNRPRQALIVREFGHAIGDERLQQCAPQHWQGWEIELALQNCGLSVSEAHQLGTSAKAFWRKRFFTSEYCREDVPNPGAADFLRRIVVKGATICYVTGRHTEMKLGSLQAFERAGFPIPNGTDVHLLLKPTFAADDDAWKVLARERLQELGTVVCAFDNEPAHINSYRVGFPECYPVHLDTDHSGRPVELLPEIPSVRDFLL